MVGIGLGDRLGASNSPMMSRGWLLHLDWDRGIAVIIRQKNTLRGDCLVCLLHRNIDYIVGNSGMNRVETGRGWWDMVGRWRVMWAKVRGLHPQQIGTKN